MARDVVLYGRVSEEVCTVLDALKDAGAFASRAEVVEVVLRIGLGLDPAPGPADRVRQAAELISSGGYEQVNTDPPEEGTPE